MGMLESRAHELARRLSQIKEVFRGAERNLEGLEGDIKLLARDAEKIEAENTHLKKQLEAQEKENEKKIADIMKRQAA